MFFTAAASLARLRGQLRQMRALADSPQLFAESRLSAWTPSEHIDHLTKVTTSIVRRLLQPEAERVDKPFQLLGRVILAAGWIPRGRGKAPERLRGVRVDAAELHASLTTLEGKLDELTPQQIDDQRGPIVPHPRFGGMRPSQALRFAAVHNEHHLRIIADILRAK
jgi:hypothetical protein